MNTGVEKKRKAFTLIELLVVVAIIALLLSILLPSLSKAKEMAKRVVCATNLKQWGTGIVTYSVDNNGKIPETAWAHGQLDERVPNVVFTPDTPPAMYSPKTTHRDMTPISVQIMEPYMGGVDFENKTIDASWLCPSNPRLKNLAEDYWREPVNGYLHMNFSYFGHIKKFASRNVDPQRLIRDLQDGRLDGSKVLMCDYVYYNQQFSLWGYNHGKNGGSIVGVGYGRQDSGPPEISGVNQLYGDGHVDWKKGERYFDKDALQARSPLVSWISYKDLIYNTYASDSATNN